MVHPSREQVLAGPLDGVGEAVSVPVGVVVAVAVAVGVDVCYTQRRLAGRVGAQGVNNFGEVSKFSPFLHTSSGDLIIPRNLKIRIKLIYETADKNPAQFGQ